MEAIVKELSILPPLAEINLVKRENCLNELDDILFKEKRWALIQGPSGIGKSMIANLYANSLNRKKPNEFIIVWFNASSRETIQQIYYSKFAKHFQLEPKDFDNEDNFIRKINEELKKMNFGILFLFDNVKEYDDVEIFVRNLEPEHFKVIATTRNENQIKMLEREKKFKNYKLNYFNEFESFEYLKINFEQTYDERTLKEFYRYFLGDRNQYDILPVLLRIAVSLYNEKTNWQITNEARAEIYLKAAASLILEQFENDLTKRKLLLIFACIEGTFISLDLVFELVNKLEKKVIERKITSDYLIELCKKGLVEFVKKGDKYGISMNESIQEIIKTCVESINEIAINQLDEITPFLNQLPDDSWKKIDYLYDHLIKLTKLENSNKSEKLANIYFKLALTNQYKLINFEKCLEYYFKAVEIYKVEHGENQPSISTAYNNIGLVYESLGKTDKCLEYYLKSLKITELIFGETHSDVATLYNNVGLLYKSLGNSEKSLEFFFKDLEISKSLCGENHPSLAITYNNIGLAYVALGNAKKGLEFHMKSLEISLLAYGNNHPNIGTSYNNIGLAYGSLGEERKSLEYLLKALEITKSIYGENHPDVATSYSNIGLAYKSLGDVDTSLMYHMRALNIYKSVYDENHPCIACCYNNIGLAFVSLGNAKIALEYYFKDLEITKSVYGETHPSTALTCYNIGLAYESLGDAQKSLEYFFKALEIYEIVYGDRPHPHISVCFSSISTAYKTLGKKVESDFYSELHSKMLKLISQ